MLNNITYCSLVNQVYKNKALASHQSFPPQLTTATVSTWEPFHLQVKFCLSVSKKAIPVFVQANGISLHESASLPNPPRKG